MRLVGLIIVGFYLAASSSAESVKCWAFESLVGQEMTISFREDGVHVSIGDITQISDCQDSHMNPCIVTDFIDFAIPRNGLEDRTRWTFAHSTFHVIGERESVCWLDTCAEDVYVIDIVKDQSYLVEGAPKKKYRAFYTQARGLVAFSIIQDGNDAVFLRKATSGDSE